MSDILKVFGTQLDPAVVQALMRHEKHRRSSERSHRRELDREGRRRRKTAAPRRSESRAADRN
jgi:hypothetical protein